MGEQYETKGATRYAYDLVFKDETTARGGPIRADQDLKTASHAVRERLALVGIRDTDGESVAVGRYTRERASMGVRGGKARAVVVRALHHVAVNAVRLQAAMERSRMEAWTTLEAV